MWQLDSPQNHNGSRPSKTNNMHHGRDSQLKQYGDISPSQTKPTRAMAGKPQARDKVTRIPNACLAPMNIMHQFTLNASGNIVDRERLTHDQSFKLQSGTSVNSRVDTDKLQRCMYGRCLMRLLCWIVAARRQFPNKPIVLQKIDVKSAYRRCHLNAVTAIKTITELTKDEL
jgi:hypothetical protein